MICRHPWFSQSAGHFFEDHALLWIRYGPTQDSLSCTPAMSGSPPLHIPTCGDNMELFSNVDELEHVNINESRKCWDPASRKFPICDTIILTKEFVITVQMTVVSEHDA